MKNSPDANAILRMHGPQALRDQLDRAVPFIEQQVNGNGNGSSAREAAPFTEAGGDEDHPPLPFIDMSSWDSNPPPERHWLVHDRIVMRQPFLLTGTGGVGKTILLLQLSAAIALARDWIGTMPEAGPVIYLAAEDEADELHRRLATIAKHYNKPFSALRDLHIMSFAGEEATLFAPDRAGVIRPTPLFGRLHKAACDLRPKLIALDTSSDVYAGSENDRNQVAAAVKLLQRMGMDADAAVVLSSHPSLSGISSGRGLSGTTGWHDKFRGRAYFKAVALGENDEETVSELRELQFMKNNFGRLNERIVLRWCDGVFVPERGGVRSLDKLAAESHAEAVFLTLLARFERERRNVTDKKCPTFAPTVFALEAEAKGIGSAALGDAMRRLFAAQKIHLAIEGPPSRPRSRLVAGAAPSKTEGT